jgi:hypothetical protein
MDTSAVMTTKALHNADAVQELQLRLKHKREMRERERMMSTKKKLQDHRVDAVDVLPPQ